MRFNSYASTSLVLEGTFIESTTTGNASVGHGTGIHWQELSVRRICNGNMLWRVNSIISNFSYCDHRVKFSLFNSYCFAYYGASLWNLEGTDTNQFHITWRL